MPTHLERVYKYRNLRKTWPLKKRITVAVMSLSDGFGAGILAVLLVYNGRKGDFEILGWKEMRHAYYGTTDLLRPILFCG